MSKRFVNRWAALVGVGLLAGCATPTLSVSQACGPGGMPPDGQQSYAEQDGQQMQAEEPSAPEAGGQAVNETDTTFVMQVGQGNNAEILLSQLALQKAANQAVRQFAQRMVRDHTAAGQALQQAASAARLTVPTGVTPEDQAVYDRLSTLSGQAFDEAYMTKMVPDHEKTVTLFQTEISQGMNQAIKGFATENLPTIEQHLRQARGLARGQAAPTS